MINTKTRKNIIRELLGKERQTTMFPYSEIIEIDCMAKKMCFNENNCDKCRLANIKYKNYDFYSNPEKIR